jgi:predicted transcriptional regulator
VLAAYENRNSHFIMKQAPRKTFEEQAEEKAEKKAKLRFIAAAKESRSHYQQTGLHLTHAEFSSWVDQLQSNPTAIPPRCHA